MKAIVDFQSAEDDVLYATVEAFIDGRTWSLRKGFEKVEAGLEVLLDDLDGRLAEGRVTDVREDGLVTLHIDWNTLRDTNVIQIETTFTGVKAYSPGLPAARADA
jgi:hypothetical protein